MDSVRQYKDENLADKHGQEKSWQYCYDMFGKYGCGVTEEAADYLALHLAFYLASWGMYRNSFLCEKDYKIHIPVVRMLLDPLYSDLRGIEICRLAETDAWNRLEELGKKIRKHYENIISCSKVKNRRVTDTLLTKILLGTLGCVPAFDTYFTKGLREMHISPRGYTRETVLKIAEFYREHQNAFEEADMIVRETLRGSEPEYPQMKLVDMFFWQIGKQQ